MSLTRLFLGVVNGSWNSWSESPLSKLFMHVFSSDRIGNATSLALLFLPAIGVLGAGLRGVLGAGCACCFRFWTLFFLGGVAATGGGGGGVENRSTDRAFCNRLHV